MPEPETLRRAGEITAADPLTRTLTVQLTRWDDPRIVTDPGRPPYRESWARGSLVPLERLYVVDRHQGELIGRMDTPYDAGVGPTSQVHIAHTRAGDDLLALVDAGVITDVSMEALADRGGEIWSPDHQQVTRTRGLLAGVAFAFHPAHDSPILARTIGGTMPEPTAPTTTAAATVAADPGDPLEAVLRSLEALPGANGNTGQAAAPPPAPAPSTQGPPAYGAGPGVGASGSPPPPAPPPSPVPAPVPGGGTADAIARALEQRAVAAQQPSIDELQQQMVVYRSALLTLVDRARTGPTYRYHSWGELMRANARGDLTATDMTALNRAIMDVTTGDIPGLIPRPVVAQIMQTIAANQQLVDAAGSVPLPDSGMTVDFPLVTARPSVGIQAAEKTEVVSAKTTVARSSAPVITLAGGEDVSIQAILRSSPSYLQLVGELYLEAMALATDAYAWSIYGPAVPAAHNISITAAVPGWIPSLFDLAGLILRDYRALPDRLVLSTDLWVKVGGAVDTEGRPIFTRSSPVNPGGSASLTSTEGDVREMSFTVDPNLPADTGLMFASSAFRSALGPVSTLTADVPLKLGRDYAVYRFGTFLVPDPQGLGQFRTAALTAAETRQLEKAQAEAAAKAAPVTVTPPSE